jgi:hypothetical protein
VRGKLSREQLLTDPEQAEFVALTGVDALAVAIGTSHGAYKFTRASRRRGAGHGPHRGDPPPTAQYHLVMHGSSSVPQELQDIINKYGGKISQTYGVPVEEIQRGIKHGVRKINVDTDNRLAITGAIRKVFAETPEKFDPRDYLKPAREAMRKVCIDRMVAFGHPRCAPRPDSKTTLRPSLKWRVLAAQRHDRHVRMSARRRGENDEYPPTRAGAGLALPQMARLTTIRPGVASRSAGTPRQGRREHEYGRGGRYWDVVAF